MVQITDVAREAGVSVATVSRVLADTGYPVRPETRQRVLDAASRLQYQPNGLGRSLRVGHSGAICVCATSLNNPTAVAAVEGIIRACRAASRHVQTTTTFSDAAEEDQYLELLAHERVAGVIAFPAGAPAAAYERLQAIGAPVVQINRRVPGLLAPVVRHDFGGGHLLAVRHFVRLGHRRIGAILPPDSPVWADQHASWIAALRAHSLDSSVDSIAHVGATSSTDGAYRAIRELLARPDPPTAVFASNALSSLIALRIIEEDGHAPGRSVALVGTGDVRWEILFPPRLPFVCLDSFGLGTTAATTMIDLIDGREDADPNADIVIPVRFVDATPSGGS